MPDFCVCFTILSKFIEGVYLARDSHHFPLCLKAGLATLIQWSVRGLHLCRARLAACNSRLSRYNLDIQSLRVKGEPVDVTASIRRCFARVIRAGDPHTLQLEMKRPYT